MERTPSTHPLALIRKAYNLLFWVFLLPFFTLITDPLGFLVFTVVIGVRLIINLFTNNILQLSPAGYDSYPFRIP